MEHNQSDGDRGKMCINEDNILYSGSFVNSLMNSLLHLPSSTRAVLEDTLKDIVS